VLPHKGGVVKRLSVGSWCVRVWGSKTPSKSREKRGLGEQLTVNKSKAGKNSVCSVEMEYRVRAMIFAGRVESNQKTA